MQSIASVKKASPRDLPAIKALADANRDSLGRAALERSIRCGQLVVACVAGQLVGFQSYYHRKRDLDTKLYYKCVAPAFRRRGIATLIVDEVVRESVSLGRRRLVLKCPEELPSNAFHRQYGFMLRGTENGRRRRLNIWELHLPRA